MKTRAEIAEDIALKIAAPRKDRPPRPISSPIISKVLDVCNIAFQNPRGETFVSSTAAAARSFRQTIYEVRRHFRSKQGVPEYRALFESHIKLSGKELHIGPHPLSFNEDFALKGKGGELIPLSEVLAEKFVPVSRDLQPEEVDLPLSYLEKFNLAARIQQGIVEVCQENRWDLNEIPLKRVLPYAKKRGFELAAEGIEPDRSIPEVEAFYEAYAEAYNFALRMEEELT